MLNFSSWQTLNFSNWQRRKSLDEAVYYKWLDDGDDNSKIYIELRCINNDFKLILHGEELYLLKCFFNSLYVIKNMSLNNMNMENAMNYIDNLIVKFNALKTFS